MKEGKSPIQESIIEYMEGEKAATNKAVPAEETNSTQKALLDLKATIESKGSELSDNVLAHNQHGLATYDPKSGFIIIESGEWKVFCNPNNPKEVKKGGSNKYIPNEVWKTMQELKREALKSFKNKQRTFNW